MIQLSIPIITEREKRYVNECLDTNWISSAGRFVNKFEAKFAEYVGMPYAVAVNCGTSALHLSLLVNGITGECDVFVPTLTFIASINSVAYTGAHPIFTDSTQESLGMSPDAVERFIDNYCLFENGVLVNQLSGRPVKAMIPVHIYGHSCEIDRLLEIARKYNLVVIEDAAEGVGCYYNGLHVGTFGDCGCFSFNGNKTMATGGGGMVVSHDKKLIDKIRHLSTQAKSDLFYFKHDEVGYNYRMNNIQAALGVGQLEVLRERIDLKRDIAAYYISELKGLSGVDIFIEQPYCKSSYWMFLLLVPNDARDDFIKSMEASGIQTRPFWELNHRHIMYNDCDKTELDNSRELYERGVVIPCGAHLKDDNIKFIVKQVKAYFTS